MIDINELRRKLQSDDFIDRIDIHANVKPVLTELLDRLEAAENDSARHKALAESALRVAKGWEDKCDALRAKIEAMERQEPVATVRINVINGNPSVDFVPGLHYLYHNDKLYLAPGAQPAPSFADAYQGAMEEAAIWKKRALEAEDLNRKFIAEINGPTHMSEPAQPASSVPDGWKLVPIVSTDEMDNAGTEHCDGYLGMAQAVWDAMLTAAPEASRAP